MIFKTPYKIIFAFKGLQASSILKHLKEYIRDKKLDEIMMPDLIIVNNSCYVFKVQIDGMRTKAGDILPWGSYRAVSDSKHIGGLSLMRLVSEIQMVSNFSSLAMVHFNLYELALFDTLIQINESPETQDIDRSKIIDPEIAKTKGRSDAE
jgi:hypothetical protein